MGWAGRPGALTRWRGELRWWPGLGALSRWRTGQGSHGPGRAGEALGYQPASPAQRPQPSQLALTASPTPYASPTAPPQLWTPPPALRISLTHQASARPGLGAWPAALAGGVGGLPRQAAGLRAGRGAGFGMQDICKYISHNILSMYCIIY